MGSFTKKNLRDVEDQAPGFGFGARQSARFATEDLEYLAFGPRHDGDGELVHEGFWD